ncbi:MAG: MurR/RpiR family transcriptional regulator, partial [Spirochaetales bacterium]|nr:MurR/RpiR family transcriptional regulator [Spirochaetales bacterium]
MKKTITQSDSTLVSQDTNEEYLARIRRKYNILSTSERRIADFLLLNGHENNLKYNINDFVKELSISAATIVRFCRTLGFSGFGEFRYYMQRGILSPVGSDTQVSADDSVAVITQKVASLLSKMTYLAAEIVDKKSIAHAIDIISNAKTILFCGVGTAGGTAQIAASIF